MIGVARLSLVATNVSQRVFLARLAGVLAFDPNGDQIGKIRDVVLTPRIGAPPRVVGLVVEVSNRRRVFQSINRVTNFDASAVVLTGVVNMRRFERRPGEVLAYGELLDRKVTVVGDDRLSPDQTVTVVDIGIMHTRSRDWEVDRVYVRKPGHSLRRRGESFLVPWSQVRGLLHVAPDQGADSLIASWDKMKPADVAAVLRDLAPGRRLQVAKALSDERLADVMEELPDDDQVQLLSLLDEERAADVLEDMEPDDAADLIGDLDPETATDLLGRMEPDEAEEIRRLMSYGEDTAGGMMTPEPVVLPPDGTVAEALAMCAAQDLSAPLASQVYVVRPPLETPTGRFIGAAHFQRLLREPPATLVSAILDTELEPITADTPLSTVARYFATYNLAAVPVVDDAGHLLGAVTVDDVIDHMLPPDWRETHQQEREA